MHGDQRILELLKQAFGKLDRPAHFTDVSHCDECAEQDTRLRLCNPRAVGFEDVARAAFDPFCVASPQALRALVALGRPTQRVVAMVAVAAAGAANFQPQRSASSPRGSPR